MSVIPIWNVPTLGLTNRHGFDGTVRPSWLMVGYRKSKDILLEFGKGKLVRSINEPIAEISHNGDDGQDSNYVIKGKMPGNARIEVRDPKTNALQTTLAVTVKDERNLGISFNFCEDGLYNKTKLRPAIANDLIAELNSIYVEQTNILFSLLKAVPLELKNVLGDIVREEPDVVDPKVKTGFAKLSQSWEWDKIFRTNADNGINVYFVPSDQQTSGRNDTLIYTKDDNCIIEDGGADTVYSLAHAIGRILGCQFTSDLNKQNHLMFWDQGLGKDFLSRSDNFIPKVNANVMNP
jgi:hypothetical protein